MKIWHQSFTCLEDLPDYHAAMKAHIRKILRPDTEFEMHGVIPGTYTTNYPGTDLAYGSLFTIHSMQWIVQALKAQRDKFDGFALATISDPVIREIRGILDMPVIGYGEASFHLACMLGHRFGVLMFIEQTIPMLRDRVATYGLQSRCVGIEPVGFTFQDVLPAFKDPQPLIERFKERARAMIKQGADVIVPGEMPLNVLLATNGVSHVDDVPIIDGLAVTMKMTEMLIELRQSTGLTHSRAGWFYAEPNPQRVQEMMSFYGLDRLLTT